MQTARMRDGMWLMQPENSGHTGAGKVPISILGGDDCCPHIAETPR